MRIRELFDEVHELLGWGGMVLILVAYMLLSMHVLSAGDKWYFFLNILGSIFLVYSSFKVKNYPLVTLNIIWVFISFYGLFFH